MSERITTQNTEARLAEDAAAATGTPVPLDPVEDRHERIASRAYEYYLSRGQQAGNDLDDWLRAERELQGDRPAEADARS